MAVEISFCVCGKETKQAFFIDEAELDVPLTKVRKIVEKQELYVPQQYKFLTKNGNAIAHPTEENIVFRDIIQAPEKDWTEKDVKFDDTEVVKEEGIKADKPIVNNSQVWITPLKVVEERENQSHNRNEAYNADTNNPGDTTNPNNSNRRNQQETSFCPYTNLKRVFCKPDGSIDVTKIAKTVIPLAVFLFVLLAILTFTMHVLVKTIMIKTGPSFVDMLSRFDEGGMGMGGGGGAEMTDLKIKLSQLEMSHKFEVEQLTNRITELEDLYLKDLDYHKRELNAIKRRLTEEGIGRSILEKAEADVDEDTPRSMKEGKRKYAASEADRSHG